MPDGRDSMVAMKSRSEETAARGAQAQEEKLRAQRSKADQEGDKRRSHRVAIDATHRRNKEPTKESDEDQTDTTRVDTAIQKRRSMWNERY